MSVWTDIHIPHSSYPRLGKCTRQGCSSPLRFRDGIDRPCSFRCATPPRVGTAALLEELRDYWNEG